MILISFQILLVALVIFSLNELRGRYGSSLLFIFVGSNQYFQTLLAATVYLEVLGIVPVSPGSAVLFSSSLMAVLLLYQQDGVIRARRLIYGILLANLTLTILTVSTRIAIDHGWLSAIPSFSDPLLRFSLQTFLVGTGLLILDTVLVLVLHETFSLSLPGWPAWIRYPLTLVLVLSLDSIIFSWTAFRTSPDFQTLVTGNLLGKVWGGALYGLLLWGYLRLREARPRSGSVSGKRRDIFSILTYRERLEKLQAEKHIQEEVYREERSVAQKELETTQERLRQAQKLEAIGRLAGGIAHDFNNLLTVILGHSSIALRRIPPTHIVHPDITAIQDAGERAAAVTRQLLAFGRKQVMTPRVISLNDLVTDLLRFLERLLGEDIRLVTELDPDLDTVEADPSQIEQVVMNLALNARDAMPTGGVLIIETAPALGIEAHDPSSGRKYVRLTVRDSGHGMDETTRSQIFEPFFTTKEIGSGTGLGLSTVHGIVSQSGGTIEVMSRPDKGSSFHVYLPAAGESLTMPASPRVNESAPVPLSILVVEDQVMVSEMVRDVLVGLGHSVMLSPDGETAISILRSVSRELDLIVTDIVLPGMSGADLARHVRQDHPGVALAFMTGYPEGGLAPEDDLRPMLSKPFTRDDLVRALQEAMEKQGPRSS